MLHIACPDCSNRLNVAPEAIGATVTCPACGQSFVVSKPGMKPESPPPVVLEPVPAETDPIRNDSAPTSTPESVAAPLSCGAWALIVVACFCVFSLVTFGMALLMREDPKSTYPKVFIDDRQKAFLDQVTEKSRQSYHELLNDIRETESEIDSFGESDARIAHLAALKARCGQAEAGLLSNLSRDQLVEEEQKARTDLQAAETDLQTIEGQHDETRAKWQKERS